MLVIRLSTFNSMVSVILCMIGCWKLAGVEGSWRELAGIRGFWDRVEGFWDRVEGFWDFGPGSQGGAA